MNEKITNINKEIEERDNDIQEIIDAISIENKNLKKQQQCMAQITPLKQVLAYTARIARTADLGTKYNEQYSLKNNIKI